MTALSPFTWHQQLRRYWWLNLRCNDLSAGKLASQPAKYQGTLAEVMQLTMAQSWLGNIGSVPLAARSCYRTNRKRKHRLKSSTD